MIRWAYIIDTCKTTKHIIVLLNTLNSLFDMNQMTIRTMKITSALLVLLVVIPAHGQQIPGVSYPRDAKPYHLLVLGDSITWGQGLKKEHKAWHQVKVWLEKQVGRPVVERVEAHSGAVIDGGPTREIKLPGDSEVSLGFPSIYEQVDNARRFYSDGSAVDLVLVSGCANDAGTETFLNAANSEELHRLAEQKCRPLMESLLRKVTSSFPVAQVIVVGYYPFFSEKTPNDLVTRTLARSLFKSTRPDAPTMDSKQVFARLAANSREWYSASDKSLSQAVGNINVELGSDRVAFAKINFLPEYSFATKETRLWGFNRSPFRMMLVFLSMGRIKLPINDEVSGQRKASCDRFYRASADETVDQKRERKSKRLLCQYAALGHPNRKGATLYANAIVDQLKHGLASRNSLK
jgi:lysophospholipase L1-like esterase